jgi:RimJ/RimL family protein N-acetyltransferase
LVAERLSLDHLADLIALHLDPAVSRYLGGVRSAAATKAYLDVNMAHWDRLGFGLWAWRTHQGDFVGRAGVRPLTVEGASEIEVAYALRRDAWGQGFASEMTQALADLGLARPDIPSLVGVVFINNIGSRRVLEKSGFVLEKPVIHAGEASLLYRRSRPPPRDGSILA